MKKLTCVVSVVLLFVALAVTADPASQDSLKAQDTEAVASLNDHLKPFLPLIGKTWRGTSLPAEAEDRMSDVSHWERALNGQGIRILHSVNDGEYGGETIDLKQQ